MWRRILARGGAATTLGDLGLLALRVGAGYGIATHGAGKLPPPKPFVALVAALGFPAPEVFAWLAGLAEFGGGILLALGLLTRPAAVSIFVVMLVAFFGAHRSDPFTSKELSLLYGLIMAAFAAVGGGRFSIDAALAGGAKTRK